MSARTDVINLSININGNESQNKLNDLRKRAVELTVEMKGLKKGTDEYINASKELQKVSADMVELKKTIGLAALNEKELVKELNTLKALRGSVIPFSNEYKELSKSIKTVQDRLYDVRNGVQGFASFFSKIKDEVKQFGVVAAGYLGFEFLFSSFKNLVSGAGKLSDQLADLRRVTGLTDVEVRNLNKSLSQLDTRTGTTQLREIAIVAGKLGIAKGDILGFVEATDKLVVALGDELGDADKITTELGKILNVFNGQVDGTALTGLGNAIVELANAGVSTGGFISDFTQRVAGLAKASNLSLGTTVGLAAGFEELGLRSESSSTALQKLVSTIASDLPKAAKIAGATTAEEVAQFADLFAKAPQEALIKFAEGLTLNKSSFAEITASFADAGEEGARVVQTLNAIGQRGDFLREKIDLGNKSIKESTAINEAFALKNETLGSTLDKLEKDFARLVNSPGVQNFLQKAIEGVVGLVKALGSLFSWIGNNIEGLATLAVGLLLMNKTVSASVLAIVRKTFATKADIIATYQAIAVEKAKAIINELSIRSQLLYGIAVELFTGKIKLATAAQQVWTYVMAGSLGPLGAIIAVIGAVVLAYNAFADNTNKLAAAEKARQQVFEKANESIAEETSKITYLTAAIKDHSISLGTRQAALKELIDLNPAYLKGLTLENIATEEGVGILNRYNQVLLTKARLEAAQSLLAEKTREDLKLALKLQEQEKSLANAGGAPSTFQTLLGSNQITAPLAGKNTAIAFDIAGTRLARKELKAETDAIIKLATDAQKSLDNISIKPEKPAEKDPPVKKPDSLLKDDAKKTGKSAAEKEADELDKLLEQSKKFYEEIKRVKARADTEDLSPRDREIEQVNLHYDELLKKATEYFEKLKAITKGKGKDFLEGEQRLADERKILEEAAGTERLAIMRKFNQKEFEERTRNEYADALVNRKEYSEDLKQATAQDYADGIITKKQFEAEIKTIERNERSDLVLIAQDYANNVTQAEKDLRKFRKENAKGQTDDQIQEVERLKAYNRAEALAGAKRAVLTTRPGTRANRDARNDQALLNFQFDTAEFDENSEQYLARYQEFTDELKAIDTEYIVARTEQVASYLQKGLDLYSKFSDFLSAKENAELNRDRRANDQKKKNYQKQLSDKLISQAVYDKKVNEADEAYDKKKKEIERRQFERNKKIQIVQAIISGAVAVVQAFAQLGPIAGAIAAVFIGLTTGLQIATIKKQEYQEMGTGGLLKNGPKHSSRSRGLPVVNPETGRIEALLERNEAIMSSNTMDDNNSYTVSGTPSQIASTLNGINGGATWDRQAKVVPMRAAWQGQPLPRVRSSVPKIMAEGGRLPASSGITANNDEALDLQRQQIAMLQMLGEKMDNYDREKKSYVVLKELKAVEELYETSKRASGF